MNTTIPANLPSICPNCGGALLERGHITVCASCLRKFTRSAETGITAYIIPVPANLNAIYASALDDCESALEKLGDIMSNEMCEDEDIYRLLLAAENAIEAKKQDILRKLDEGRRAV